MAGKSLDNYNFNSSLTQPWENKEDDDGFSRFQRILRDGKEELGIRFGSERDMEDTELEEGESCSYHNINNDDDYDASMDPAPRYKCETCGVFFIPKDEKLQDVLGHFQKDFEGGVSTENLGAKFGGYGSFLSTYQRSLGWSHPRASPKT